MDDIRRWLTLSLQLLVIGHAQITFADDTGTKDFRGYSVVEVISYYRKLGMEIVYSTDLVDPQWKLDNSPEPANPQHRLQSILQAYGLKIEQLRKNTWVITRHVPVEVKITGIVSDGFNMPVQPAMISVSNMNVNTDYNGSFELSLLPGDYVVKVQAATFKDYSASWHITNQSHQNLDIELKPINDIKNVIVSVSLYKLSNEHSSGSQNLLTRQQIENVPTLGDDAVRAVNTLPGTATIGYSSKPRVRGGTQDEVLVIFDGVELIEPFHLKDFQNLFSTLNPGTIQSINFYTGGFPAKYGNRMSGVIDIATQGVGEKFGGELSLTTFSTSALAYGITNSLDWLIAMRRGNLDVITDIVNPEVGNPSYSDSIFRIGKNFYGGQRLEITALNYTDDVDINRNDTHTFSSIENRYFWFKWQGELTTDLLATSILSSAKIDHHRNGISDDEPKLQGTVVDKRNIEILGLKQIVEWKPSGDLLLEGGAYFYHNRANYEYSADVTRGELAIILGNDDKLTRNLNAKFDGESMGAYFSSTVNVSDTISIQSGIRFDIQNYLNTSKDEQMSLRFGILYQPSRLDKFRLSLGRFFQPQGIHELQIADGIESFFKPQQSDQFVIGFEHQFVSQIFLKSELFYKKIKNNKPRFLNLFNPFVVLPEVESDRIRIDSNKAYAKGIEISLSNSPDNNFHWWLNYSLSKVEDLGKYRWIPRGWDQTHTVNVGLNWHLQNWNFSAAGSWHTGWPTTTLPEQIAEEEVIDLEVIRNKHKYRDYGTIDVRLSYEAYLQKSTLTGFIEIANIINRTNDGGVDYEPAEEQDSNGFILIINDSEPVFPLATSIGIIWKF